MDVVAKIIVHTLSSDRAPPVKFVDGVPIFPEVPALLPGEVPRNKVAVYQEFASLGRVLRNVSL
jgi:TATA-binding protein-associated factor